MNEAKTDSTFSHTWFDSPEKWVQENTAMFPNRSEALALARAIQHAKPYTRAATEGWPVPVYHHEIDDTLYRVTYHVEPWANGLTVYLEASIMKSEKSLRGKKVSKEIMYVRDVLGEEYEADRHFNKRSGVTEDYDKMLRYLSGYAAVERKKEEKRKREAHERQLEEIARHPEEHVTRTYRNNFDGHAPSRISVAGRPYVLHDETYYASEYGHGEGDPMVVAEYAPETRTPQEVNGERLRTLREALADVESGNLPETITIHSGTTGRLYPEGIQGFAHLVRWGNLGTYDTAETWDYPPTYEGIPLAERLRATIAYLQTHYV